MNSVIATGAALLGRLKILHRLLLVLACAGVGASVIAGIMLSTLYQNLIEDRQQSLRYLVDTAYSVVVHWAERERQGAVTTAEAQAAAKSEIALLRYGNDNYLWINDLAPRMIMHPLRPELNGTDLSSYRDKRGKLLFREFVEVVRRDGAGFVGYYWPQPGGDAEVEKLSYVKGFAPWGWIVGSGIYVDDVDTIFRQKLTQTGGLMLATLLAVGMVALAIARSVARPVERLTLATTALSQGQLETDVPERGRRDEIGALAQAVQVFKESMVEAERLRAEQAEAQAGQERRTRAIASAVAGFEAGASGVVKAVAAAASDMKAQAQAFAATAAEASQQAGAVAAASEQATRNVESAATAGEQLSASIAEIGRQAATSTEVTGAAVDQAQRTNAQVQSLAEAAQRIGDVVRLINDIAGQTNLLALNATIEAARAGEAGKGFAVVATEVKNLASQTARATGEIGQQVAEIQGATRESVKAIQSIAGTIGQVNAIATAIAAAVTEQRSATSAIARNVQQAAEGTGEVLGHIGGVTEAANEAGTAANRLLTAAGVLSEQADELHGEVDRFLVAVRAA